MKRKNDSRSSATAGELRAAMPDPSPKGASILPEQGLKLKRKAKEEHQNHERNMLPKRCLELQKGEAEHQNHERGLQQTTLQSNKTQKRKKRRKKLDQCSAEVQHARDVLDQSGDETATRNATHSHTAVPAHSCDGEEAYGVHGGDAYDVHDLMAAWAWKREHLPDKLRFRRPYKHPLDAPLQASTGQLHALIHQQRFQETGFASTVWDSSIVVAKLLEVHAGMVRGAEVCDLSAGTGLVGVVAGMLGGRVCATDLEGNLPLLKRNIAANGVSGSVRVEALEWGHAVTHVGRAAFDLVVACDVMYIVEAVEPLVATLRDLLKDDGTALVAHGRNCSAEGLFLAEVRRRGMHAAAVPRRELHTKFWAPDVTVLRVRRNGAQHHQPSSQRGDGP